MALADALSSAQLVHLLEDTLSALGYKLRMGMQIELKRLQHEAGVTFIFFTHAQQGVRTMSDRMTVKSSGFILQVGASRDINHRTSGRFVAAFISQ